ncbi:MAG: hypothetical protein IIB65_04360 [Proteobacteria bacterium]|nr:hypothetical protein [Pseudomonadota bacterium]
MFPKFFYALTLTLAILAVFTVPAGAATVIITKADCAALVRHVAEPGVAYESGVDVNGRPVVPADLGDAPEIKLPEEIVIAITVDIDKRFNIPPTPDLYRPEATIGTVIVKKDGRAYFNGQPLTSEESHGLAAACQKQGPAG